MIDSIILEDVEKIRGALRKGDFENKRVLITGGAGFVGSWICDVLAGFDAEVTCLDDLSTGKRENIDHLLGKSFFKFVEDDVCNFQSKAKFDYVLHLASRASPEEYQQHPIETLKTNSLGSYNMLELARKNDAKILFASTSEVYGDAQVVPTPETYWGNVNPIGVRSCYDEGKRFGEALFMAYHRQYGLDVRIARIFNSYGPRLRSEGAYGRAVSRFITQALAGQPLTVYGDGTQTRSFCYVSDTVTGLLLLLTSEKIRGEVVNIGNPEEITILELAQRIKRLANSASSITFHPLPSDDPKRRCPNTNRAQKLMKWEAKINLEQGLARTITWFRRNWRA
jgi:UDP-glucuronate decarboxylase